jgi:hypothetical protein
LPDRLTLDDYFITDMAEIQVLLQEFQRIPVGFDGGHVPGTTAYGFDPHGSGPRVKVQKSAIRKPITQY